MFIESLCCFFTLQIPTFVPKSKLEHEDAIAIRWENLPEIEEIKTLKKSELFAQLAKFTPTMCSLSQKRDMKQEDGSSKPTRCVIIYTKVFQQHQLEALAKGITIVVCFESDICVGIYFLIKH